MSSTPPDGEFPDSPPPPPPAGFLILRLFQLGLAEFADDFADDLQQANELHGWGAPTAAPGTGGAETQVRKAGRVHSVGVLVKGELVVLVDTSRTPPDDPATLTRLVHQEPGLLR